MPSAARYAVAVPVLVVAAASCVGGAGVNAGPSGVNGSADAKGTANAQASSGGSGASQGSLPPSTLSDADANEGCAAVADAMCKKLASCSPNYADGNGDLASCIDSQKRLCAVDFRLPGVVTTKAELTACGKRIADKACDVFSIGFAECAVKGAIASGSGCAIDGQCKSGICSKTYDEDSCGKCADTVAAGGACANDRVCPAGTACINDKCAAPAKLGQACKGLRCAPGSACGEKSNKCEAAGAAGQHRSDTGSSCHGKNVVAFLDQCINILPPVAQSGKCGDGKDSITYCRVGACRPDHTCLPNIPEGAACGGRTEAVCAWPFGCHDGKCRLVSANDDDVKRCF